MNLPKCCNSLILVVITIVRALVKNTTALIVTIEFVK